MNSPKIESLEFKNDEKKQISSKISELPEFAEVCYFMNHFGEKLGVILTFPRIAHLLSCETDADLQVLTTLLVKLLNKMRLRTQLNRWQPALGRFLQRHAYNCDELRSIGDALNNGGPPTLFFSLPPEKRLRVLLFCLETQFQLNVPFKEKVKSMDTKMLRTPPLGIDIFGNSYWLLVDNECHFLLYRAEPVEMTLELLGDTFPALETIIADLKDDKYEKTPISELYAVFQGSLAKTESPEAFDISSPQHISLPPPPSFAEECKVIERMASPVKEDVLEQLEEKPFAVDEKVILSENTDIEFEKRDAPGGEQLPEKTASERVITEETEPKETTGKHELTVDNTRVDSQIETLGLRRSSRKRKQVEFLSMESFYAPKTRSKKPMLPNPIPKIEKKPKKEKSHKEKTTKKCCKPKKSKKSRNGHNGNGGCLWTHSPEDSESDKDEDEDLWAEDGSNFGDNGDSSLPENEKQLPHDWLEDIESDFDEGGDDNNSDVVAGRNLQRQKAQVLDEAPCQICTISNHPEWLLLCDSCDLGYHAQCLRPALHYIPPGDWFCPRCLHSRLVTALSDQLISLQTKSKKLDSAARMQERLNFVNISVSNILRDERTRFSAAADSENSTSYSSSSESEEISRRPGQKRPRYHGSEVSSSGGSISDSKEDSETSDGDDIQEEEEKLSVRSTRHRKIRYDINAAFQQLDEVLVEDEKYAQEKMERSKAKSVYIEEGVETKKEETDLPGGLPMPPSSVISKTTRKKRLSSSSLDASDSEEIGRKKRRKRLSSGSEEFRPSDESITDEDDSELGEVEEESDGNASESSASSDQSWKVGRNRRRQGKRRGRGGKRRSKHRRSGRTGSGRRRDRRIPRFEGPSTDEDDDEIPVRRSARIRVNYREIDTSEEEEDEEDKKKSSRRGKRISSGSEYAPSQEEEAEVAVAGEKEEIDENARNKKNEEVENRVPVQPIQKLSDFPTSGVRNISQALTTDFPITPELELDENELQIDEDLMSVKEDDPIFQNFLIDDINLPINQDPNDDVDGM